MKFTKGERVQHQGMPEWGLGQVLEDSHYEKVKVFFVSAGEKVLKLPANLMKVKGDEAVHPMLENLKVDKTGKVLYYRSLEQLKDDFLRTFPKGFYDNKYLEDERNYKFEAHRLLLDLLNKQSFTDLLNNTNYNEICRRALQVVNKTNLIFPN